MPKISSSGVSDKRVHPDYIAPPGMAPGRALDLGLPDAGQPEEEEGEQSSPGKTSSPDSKPHEQLEPKQSDAGPTRSTARSTAGRSKSPRTASITASSVGT